MSFKISGSTNSHIKRVWVRHVELTQYVVWSFILLISASVSNVKLTRTIKLCLQVEGVWLVWNVEMTSAASQVDGTSWCERKFSFVSWLVSEVWTAAGDYVFWIYTIFAVPMSMADNAIKQLIRLPLKTLHIFTASCLRLKEKSKLCAHI